MNVKQRMIKFLSKTKGRNTFSVKQARHMWQIENVAARIHELRKDGYPIYTNVRKRGDGTTVFVYRLGTPSKSMRQTAKAKGVFLQRVA